MKKKFEITGIDLTELYGIGDQNILFLEESLPLNINIRGNNLFCQGLKKDLDYFSIILGHMVDSIKKGNNLHTKDINQLLAMNMQKTLDRRKSISNVIFYGKKGPVHAKTDGQKKLLDSLCKNDIVISIGPAGTGKTFLAVAYALSLLEKHEIEKIIFCRPAVEAGESLGFLPGDLKDKIDPYLAPLYDALHELLPKSKIQMLLSKGVIEIIPLAYMRGRTINRSIMILDEAQNASTIQMKMFLTRLGIDSRAIITGDISQIDLPKKSHSGLVSVLNILKNIKDIGIVELNEHDVARHYLVKHIINAYSKSKG
ncbi:MAG: phosphate starvation-inducible protein PhoH [Candidatus Marinimicrobia bacterium]|jgi:phosphate starvation-inducible PhoH-like protein|nr:phosphate starvation-inducible protein PhoH [Candidatus Neomarinimicrobiota bacterium]|tara:strand:+ start:40229 stop:41167 length:939 start_codon:yes stop_codon:yes gene_type:complete